MKKILFAMLTILFLTPLLALAQATGIDIPVETNESFLTAFVAMVSSFKGLSTAAIVLSVAQLFMMFVGTPWANKLAKNNGAWKITAYLLFSVIATVTTLIVKDGVSLGSALLSAPSLAALGVLANQLYKQFVVKKD